jgi:PGF-pre-PGF domain-containing protein
MNKSKIIVLVSFILFAAILAGVAFAGDIAIILNSPASGANSTTNMLTANFTAINTNQTADINCTLYTNAGVGQTNSNVSNNTATVLLFPAPATNAYTWNVTCFDAVGGLNTSETRTWNFDNSTVVISDLRVNESDFFYSDASVNNRVTFLVNATDTPAGVAYITADFTALGQGVGPVNMTRVGSTNVWAANITVTNVTSMNFAPKNITIATAADSFGNVGFQNIGPAFKTVVLYDMELPPEGPCMQWGSLTTNFSAVTNFAAVNFVLQHKENLSCSTPGGLPPNAPAWTSTYEPVVLINFTSIDISTPEKAQKLQNLQNAFQADLVAPHMFGDSRIYFNTTYFVELNTTTTITMYHLPFISEPNIVVDTGAAGTTGTTTWALGVGEGNLTFSVLGFSGYNLSDNTAPSIAFSTPTTNLSSTVDSTPFINVTLNGTKTQITHATFAITGATTANYSYDGNYSNTSTGYTNTANCYNATANSELFYCRFNTSTLADGSHTLTVNAWDFGGNDPGNTASAAITFSVDTAAPVVTINNPAASSWKNANFTINVTITDATALVVKQYKITNGSGAAHTAWTNLTNTAGNDWTAAFNASETAEGNYTVYINATDTIGGAGHVNDTVTALFWVDRTVPTISSFSLSDTTPKEDDTVTGTCTATDNLGTATTAVTGISTSTIGSKTATCTATDNAGNTATSTVSYTVSRESTGGGGGGGSSASAGSVISGSSAIVSSVASGETAEFKIVSTDAIAVSAVDIAFDESASNARVTVNKLNSLPTTITSPSEKTYQVLAITKTNIADSAIKSADINFKVAKSWLTENGLGSGDVAMYRMTDAWNALPTAVVSEDADYVYYTATTPGFSYFVIGQKAGTTATVTTPETTVEQPPVTPPAATTPAAEQKEPVIVSKPMWPWYLLGLVVVAIVLALLLRPKKHNR